MGLANKIYASAYVENFFGEKYESLLFLDLDSVVLKPINPDILGEKFLIAIKPEDEDHYSNKTHTRGFWRLVYERCKVFSEDLWTVKSALNQKKNYSLF